MPCLYVNRRIAARRHTTAICHLGRTRICSHIVHFVSTMSIVVLLDLSWRASPWSCMRSGVHCGGPRLYVACWNIAATVSTMLLEISTVPWLSVWSKHVAKGAQAQLPQPHVLPFAMRRYTHTRDTSPPLYHQLPLHNVVRILARFGSNGHLRPHKKSKIVAIKHTSCAQNISKMLM